MTNDPVLLSYGLKKRMVAKIQSYDGRQWWRVWLDLETLNRWYKEAKAWAITRSERIK
jgi:hypothetical protein